MAGPGRNKGRNWSACTWRAWALCRDCGDSTQTKMCPALSNKSIPFCMWCFMCAGSLYGAPWNSTWGNERNFTMLSIYWKALYKIPFGRVRIDLQFYAEIASWSPDTIAGKFYLRSQLPVARYTVRDDMNIGLYVFASAQGSTSSLQLVFPPFWTLRYSAPAPIPSFQTIPFVFWTTSCDPQGLFGGLSRQLAQCDPLLWTHAS